MDLSSGGVVVMRALGTMVAHSRKRAGLRQNDLARLTGIHPMSISKIERGIQKDVGVQTLHKIAIALGTKASLLVAGAELLSKHELTHPDAYLLSVNLGASS